MDVIITEIGGTVGDIESQPYLEAIRQVACEKGRQNVVFIHVTAGGADPRLWGVEEQADPALGQGAALCRHPAGCAGLPDATRR